MDNSGSDQVTTNSDTDAMRPHDHAQVTAWLEYLATRHPPTTINAYRAPVTRAARELPNGLLATDDELAAWIATLRAKNTRASARTALRAFYGWARRAGRIEGADPAADLPPAPIQRGIPRPVPPAQIHTILTRARETTRNGYRIRLWCLLMVRAGLRCCEIATLDRADVTEEAIWVRGKGDKERLVHTHPQVWEQVRDLPAGPIAAGRNAKQVSAIISAECQRRLDLPGVTAHRLRHTFLTRVQGISGNIRITQQVAGHASPTTTAIYTLVSDVAMREAVFAAGEMDALTPTGVVPADHRQPEAVGRRR